jgi:glutamyl-tRNA reductase
MVTVDWRLAVCGINHKTASVEQREPLQLGPEHIARAHAEFADLPGVYEIVIISTCNRVEFYMVSSVKNEPLELVSRFYQNFRGIDINSLQDCFYVQKGKHAAEHLFRVAAGVDSMVLGENQIQGQIRDAYSSACSVKVAGKVIHRLFHHAFRVGKQVRTDTAMGKGACSVSSAATELLRSRLSSSDRPTVLFIGVNKMISLAASAWSKMHHEELLFANRTPEKAQALAARYKSQGYGLDKLPELLSKADIVITSTGSGQPIITDELMSEVDGKHKLIIMDIAIPRDVAIDSRRFPKVKVFDLEAVKTFVAERQAERRAAIPAAEELIARRLNEFSYWYDHARFEVSYNGLQASIDTIYSEELGPVLGKLDPEQRHEVARATKRLAQRVAQLELHADKPNK